MSARDGGQAFPLPITPDPNGGIFDPRGYGAEGMSLRDYFAAHAPENPPKWFIPVMPPPPPQRWIGDSGLEYADFMQAKAAEGIEFILNADAHLHDAWLAEKERQRYIQWPYAWADEMLRAREK